MSGSSFGLPFLGRTSMMTLDAKLDAWAKKLKAERLTPRTVHFYTETVHAVAQILADHGHPYMPVEVRPSDVRWLMDFLAEKRYSVQTRKGYLSALRRWCRDGGNRSIHQWPKTRFPVDTRPTVTWLTSEQTRELLACDKTPLQAIVIDLELRQGLRHVEVIRVMCSDVDLDGHLLTVTGKGPIGGKPRRVPLTEETERSIRSWLAVRSSMVSAGRARFPKSFVDPGNLIVWQKAGKISAYSEEGYGLDKVVTIPLTATLGYSVTNHALRRTFGRALYRAGVEVATISRILGHESTEVTLRYIGVDLDDMRDAMQRDIFGGRQ